MYTNIRLVKGREMNVGSRPLPGRWEPPLRSRPQGRGKLPSSHTTYFVMYTLY